MDAKTVNEWLKNVVLALGIIGSMYGGYVTITGARDISKAAPDAERSLRELETRVTRSIYQTTSEVRDSIKNVERRLEKIDDRLRGVEIDTARKQ